MYSGSHVLVEGQEGSENWTENRPDPTALRQQKTGRMGEFLPVVARRPRLRVLMKRGGLLTAGVGGRSRVRSGLVDRAGVDRQA